MSTVSVSSPWWWLSSNDDGTLDTPLLLGREAVALSESRHESVLDTWNDPFPHTAGSSVAQGYRGDLTVQMVAGLIDGRGEDEMYRRLRALWMTTARLWLRSPSGRVCMPVSITHLTRILNDSGAKVVASLHVVQQGAEG